ncbi:hypothetical protein K474DRAFT_1665453 [Panus rudis PR-1116 ss-1]|nr:hypothetical protein K474DRAFT_1665453 [Panus rudis PR-1116 ss-1]
MQNARELRENASSSLCTMSTDARAAPITRGRVGSAGERCVELCAPGVDGQSLWTPYKAPRKGSYLRREFVAIS